MDAEIKLCECGCGQPTTIAARTSVTRGTIKGQPKRFVKGHNKPWLQQVTHGMSHTPEKSAYACARNRCTNPKSTKWPDYGGRGIKFLFTSFVEFIAHIGTRPSNKHSLDRIDNDGHYAPGNVRWAIDEVQRANRRCTRQAA